MGAERWDEQVGSVADEAARLLESLRRSAAEEAQAAREPRTAQPAPAAAQPTDDATTAPRGPAAGESAGGPAAGGPPSGGARPASGPPGPEGGAPDHDPATCGAAPHDPVCQWCPICRGAAVVRSLSPQTLVRLSDLAAVAASVLADLASARTAHAAPAAPPGTDDPARSGGAASHRPTAAPSRQIPVSDAADDPQEVPRD